MGRLIDIDKARKEYSNLTDLTMNDTTLLLTLFSVLDNATTVEQESTMDKIRSEIKALTSNRGFLSCSVDYIHEEIDAVFDKYKVDKEQ